jgi:hypothetical protein
LVAVVVWGCDTVPGPKFREVERDLLQSKEHIQQLDSQVSEQQATIKSQQQQVNNVRGIKADMHELEVPDKIQMESLSGGYAPEGKVGDIGLILYVQPVDRDGDVIKAAGTIDVKLVDLANPPDRMLIATYHFDVPTTRSLWYGRLLTSHFSVKCPFPPDKMPTHSDITAQVTFTDLLSGRVLQAQGVYKVTFPPQLSGGTSSK